MLLNYGLIALFPVLLVARAALRYQAHLFYAKRLPTWIKFDNLNRHFEFHPPRDASGSLRIRVVARDFDGLEAEESFTLTWGMEYRN